MTNKELINEFLSKDTNTCIFINMGFCTDMGDLYRETEYEFDDELRLCAIAQGYVTSII